MNMGDLNYILTITIADRINIVIACLTLLAVIVSLLTINEMRKQRVNSYHPDINMANFSFYVYKGDFVEGIDSIILYKFKDKQDEDITITGYNELKMDINNIGLGVAKDVIWYWQFDLEKAEKKVCNNNKVVWEKGDPFLSISSKELNILWTYYIEESNSGGFINFILPYSNENRKTEIEIPSYYIDMYWLYMVNELCLIKPDSPFKPEFPPLVLNIDYTDIYARRLVKTFMFNLAFDLLSGPSGKNKELARLRFEITEK